VVFIFRFLRINLSSKHTALI